MSIFSRSVDFFVFCFGLTRCCGQVEAFGITSWVGVNYTLSTAYLIPSAGISREKIFFVHTFVYVKMQSGNGPRPLFTGIEFNPDSTGKSGKRNSQIMFLKKCKQLTTTQIGRQSLYERKKVVRGFGQAMIKEIGLLSPRQSRKRKMKISQRLRASARSRGGQTNQELGRPSFFCSCNNQITTLNYTIEGIQCFSKFYFCIHDVSTP